MSNENKQNPCPQKPCKSRQSSYPVDGDPNAEVRGRPVLYTGVLWIGILRRFLIPRTCGSSSPLPPCLPPGNSVQQTSDQPVAKSMSNPSTRPTDPKLLHGQSTAPALVSTKLLENDKGKKESNHLQIAALVSQIQEVSELVTGQARRISNDFGSLVQESKDSTTETIHAIRSDGAEVLRYSAVSVSGLVGYLAGIRRGVITRVVYCATGATAMAAVCYPEETRHYNKQSLQSIRKCIVYGLNLVPDGPQKQLGKGDSKASKHSKSRTSQDIKKKPTHTQTLKRESQTSNPDIPVTKNLGTLDYYNEQEQTESKLRQTQLPDSRQELIKVKGNIIAPNDYPIQVPGPYNYPPVINQTPTAPYNDPPLRNSMPSTDQYDHLPRSSGRLSSECQKDISQSLPAGAIPHSPALPAPPKTKPSYNEDRHEISQDKSYQTHLEGIKENSSNAGPEEHYSGINDSFNTLSTNKNNNVLESKNEQSSTNNTNIYFETASTPKQILVLEDNKDSYEGGEDGKHEKNKNHPYNKRLSSYYLQKSEDLTDSPTSGYDDLYSRRE